METKNPKIEMWVVEITPTNAFIGKYNAKKVHQVKHADAINSSTKYAIKNFSPFFIQDGELGVVVRAISIEFEPVEPIGVYFSLSEKAAQDYVKENAGGLELIERNESKPAAVKNELFEEYKGKDNLIIVHYRKNTRPANEFTMVGIRKDGGIHVGISFCNPVENFCKKLGAEQAFARAISQPIVFNGVKKTDYKSIRGFLYNLADVFANNRILFSENMYKHDNNGKQTKN